MVTNTATAVLERLLSRRALATPFTDDHQHLLKILFASTLDIGPFDRWPTLCILGAPSHFRRHPRERAVMLSSHLIKLSLTVHLGPLFETRLAAVVHC